VDPKRLTAILADSHALAALSGMNAMVHDPVDSSNRRQAPGKRYKRVVLG
jgi:hypothetical protein